MMKENAEALANELDEAEVIDLGVSSEMTKGLIQVPGEGFTSSSSTDGL